MRVGARTSDVYVLAGRGSPGNGGGSWYTSGRLRGLFVWARVGGMLEVNDV